MIVVDYRAVVPIPRQSGRAAFIRLRGLAPGDVLPLITAVKSRRVVSHELRTCWAAANPFIPGVFGEDKAFAFFIALEDDFKSSPRARLDAHFFAVGWDFDFILWVETCYFDIGIVPGLREVSNCSIKIVLERVMVISGENHRATEGKEGFLRQDVQAWTEDAKELAGCVQG
jgi:hypothetical protein